MPLLAPMAVLGPPPLPLLLSFSRILLPHVSHQLFLFFLFLPWKKKKKKSWKISSLPMETAK